MPSIALSLCRRWLVLACALIPLALHAQSTATDATATRLQQLSAQFWQWRATEQPFTNDDIPRLDRPAGFVAHWSGKDAAAYAARIRAFEQQWRALDVSREPVPVQVDFRLLGSAIARVYWELEVIPDWKRNPSFYIDQGLGSVYVLLLPPAPFTAERQADVVARLESVPRLLDEGRANLTDMRQPYAAIAMEYLSGIEGRMARFRDGMHAAAGFSPEQLRALDAATAKATEALVRYRQWLQPQIAGLPQRTAVGREGYLYFLRNVALLPYTPEQLLTTGEAEFQRSVTFEALQQAASTGTEPNAVYPTVEAQIADEEKQERLMRSYLSSHGILSEPAGVRHYHYAPLPPYVAALDLGVTDDLTGPGPSRLDADSVSYKSKPSANSGFFDAITARDTRPLTIHEGVPGHYYQLAWSWHHPDPIRRHYYDSESNEGIGFYAEEMMLVGGLFEGSPQTKTAIYRMMRLRALRVVVDVKLALGDFSLDRAAAYLENTVPMDRETARGEAAMFASTPGQAITYQIGKSDILHLISDARLKDGPAFSLQKTQDFIWQNGNVPFSLQRWELLGDSSEVPPVPTTLVWHP